MHLAKISDIVVPSDRIRKSFDENYIEDLATGIADIGLLHPIVCREEDGILRLVVGERRLRAIRHLSDTGKNYKCDGTKVPPGEIPYTLLSDLTDLQFRQAELEENILRRDSRGRSV